MYSLNMVNHSLLTSVFSQMEMLLLNKCQMNTEHLDALLRAIMQSSSLMFLETNADLTTLDPAKLATTLIKLKYFEGGAVMTATQVAEIVKTAEMTPESKLTGMSIYEVDNPLNAHRGRKLYVRMKEHLSESDE